MTKGFPALYVLGGSVFGYGLHAQAVDLNRPLFIIAIMGAVLIIITAINESQ